MKRYKPTLDGYWDNDGQIRIENNLVRMAEDPEGEFYRVVDVEKALNAYRDWVERGAWLVKDRITAEPKTVECNCEKQAARWKRLENSGCRNEQFWICPVHGYKKL